MSSDPVNRPEHYTRGKVECIDAIEAASDGVPSGESYLQGAAIKYLWRYCHKANPLEDLEKSRWYLDRLIQMRENGQHE